MTAIQRACRDEKVSRAEVRALIKKVVIPNSILGGTFRFSTSGDPVGASFAIFKIVTKAYRLVQ